MSKTKKLRAIDLYAGVGGWALGLEMANVQVVRSYEWWQPAAATHMANLGGKVSVADIRTLPMDEFPTDVDIVVGSPPCTQFSYSNRGGNGDIADGLKDIEKFLAVVEHVRPKFWAMENVPRVAKILAKELLPGGELSRYAHLVKIIEVIDASEWGVPQRRRRMIAGDFDLQLLLAYRQVWNEISLGEVISTLDVGKKDPVFGWPTPVVTDNLKEEALDDEELRMNRDQKTFHRVYNKMPFPEPVERPARTVTALCTRVSRESLVIADGDSYRRLTAREKASLQSFPVAYQFHSSRYAERIKMIGNAIPPLLTFNIANAFKGTDPATLSLPEKAPTFSSPVASLKPDTPRRSHTSKRSFASAIPGLRFGSGMRFDLSNKFTTNGVTWIAAFHYGPSKRSVTVIPGPADVERLETSAQLEEWLGKASIEVRGLLADIGYRPKELQDAWSESEFSRGPFAVVDHLGRVAERVISWFPEQETENLDKQLALALDLSTEVLKSDKSLARTRAQAGLVIPGLVVSAIFNDVSMLANDAG